MRPAALVAVLAAGAVAVGVLLTQGHPLLASLLCAAIFIGTYRK